MLLVDASVPPQQIDLDCANWLGRNEVLQSVFLFMDQVVNNVCESFSYMVLTLASDVVDWIDICLHQV